MNRKRDRPGLTFTDLSLAATAIEAPLERAPVQPLGRTILEAIRRTRAVVSTNANLGIVLCLAPLARTFFDHDYRGAIRRTLEEATVEDSVAVFEAIRLAEPGGLGEVDEEDVRETPRLPLREVMRLASARDLIARQYDRDFEDVFEVGLPVLERALEEGASHETATVRVHLEWLARFPDSLIARKHGEKAAVEVSRAAREVLEQGWPHAAGARRAFEELDAWLRRPDVNRNPGTSADLTAATLFLALRNGIIGLPISGDDDGPSPPGRPRAPDPAS